MKRNITINLQGRLYAIDDDAYDLLKRYEDSLHSHFDGKDGGPEIVADIESRIAELFDELKAQGRQAIEIGDVQRVITRIGNPQQMDEDGEADTQSAETQDRPGSGSSLTDRLKGVFVRPGKRLFRDPDDKRVLGVMSGLSHYYGGDVTWWRIGIAALGLLLLLPNWSLDNVAVYLLVLYFVFGLVMPVAKTPEEKLQMKGKPVTPHNLAEEVTAEDKRERRQPADASSRQGCLGTFGDVVMVFLKVVMWLVFASVIMVFVSMLVGLLLLLFAPTLAIFSDNGLAFSWATHPQVGTLAVVSLTVFIVLVVYGISRGLSSRRNPPRGMSTGGRIAYILLLLASLTGAMACGTIILTELEQQKDTQWKVDQKAYETKHTHGGIFVDDDEWKFLNNGGWTIADHAGCDDNYVGRGEYYTGNDNRQYLESRTSDGGQLYQVERSDSTLAPGTYTLSAMVRADGPGAYIYAVADGQTYKVEIPAEGNTGGEVWQDAKSETATLDGGQATGKMRLLKQIADANDGNGYGWSRVSIPAIVSRSGRVSYGLTSVPQVTGDHFDGTWFSACDFKLTRE